MQFYKKNTTLNKDLPPSEVIKNDFNKSGQALFEDEKCQQLARKVLLKPSDVSFWLEHLKSVQEHRREGARKAALTRKRSKKKTDTSSKVRTVNK